MAPLGNHSAEAIAAIWWIAGGGAVVVIAALMIVFRRAAARVALEEAEAIIESDYAALESSQAGEATSVPTSR